MEFLPKIHVRRNEVKLYKIKESVNISMRFIVENEQLYNGNISIKPKYSPN
jgi:hypothetical protein